MSQEVLQIAEKRKEAKGKGEKEKHAQLNEFQRIAWKDNMTFLNEQYKEIEVNNRIEGLEISSSKLKISREHFLQGQA